MIKIQNLSTGYEDERVIQHMNLTVPEGKVTVLFGPNGCGKSTLLKTICGVIQAQEGEILCDGENLLEMESKLRARKVTYLSQGRRIPDITVRRLVLHGRFPYLSYPRKYRKEDYDIAEQAMAEMQIEDLADTPVEQLSGGQRQKVYIAMALAQNTPIILLDEPTTYLDMKHQLQMLRHAKKLSEQGKTVVMVVHDLDQAMNVADYVVLLNKGTVVAEGTPEEVYLSGQISDVFDVKIGRVQTEKNWHYYCEED